MWARKYVAEQDIHCIARDARDYALCNGLVLRSKEPGNDNQVRHAPFTLFPTPFPRRIYEECLGVQPIFNLLLAKLAQDVPFLNEVLEKTCQQDEFTCKLLDIVNYSQKEGVAQPIMSCINRSDYMLDMFSPETESKILRARQVEINAIASGMSSHGTRASKLHNFLMSKYSLDQANVHGNCIPHNDSLQVVASGLIDAFNLYSRSNTYILTVTETQNYNFADQQSVELAIHNMRPDIRVIRKPFHQMPSTLKLGPNKELLIDNNKEIAVVYFRYCYDLSNYSPNSKELWDTRLLIERSRAIKCPSINYHVSGAKKFQQVLSQPQRLERFLNAGDSRRLNRLFCRMWSLDQSTEEGKIGYEEGLKNYDGLVMKPQREGGGHNLFGNEIVDKIGKLNREELVQYILMDYINSPKERNWLLTSLDEPQRDSGLHNSQDQLISELGIFGSIVTRYDEICANRFGGYLVRSKRHGVKENGVASGYAGLSSLLLIDDTREDINLKSFYNEDLTVCNTMNI